jgi:exonuclease VII large subunit
MEKDETREKEKYLLGLLKEEFEFFKQLYEQLEKQKRLLDQGENSLEKNFVEVEKLQQKILQSQNRLKKFLLENWEKNYLEEITSTLEVRKVVFNIRFVLEECQKITQLGENLVNSWLTKIKEEMKNLKKSEKLLSYADFPTFPQFVDQKK